MITDAMLTDADIDTMRERMAARSPLAAIAHSVWGEADAHSVWDDPAGHEELIRELVDPIRAWITSAAGNGGAPCLLTKMAGLVTKAMIMQHQFTEKICRASCLSPFLDDGSAAMARANLVREGFLDPVDES